MKKKIQVKVNGNPYEVEVGDLSQSPVTVLVNGHEYVVEFSEEKVTAVKPPEPAEPLPAAALEVPASPANTLTAPMPGKILDITVKVGQKITAGQPVCALEAMKMKNIIRSPREGIVASLEVADGQKVPFGAVIIRYA